METLPASDPAASQFLAQIKESLSRQATSSLLQMPLWPEDRRGIPNELVRSALFCARNHRIPRQTLEDTPIVVIGDGEITYSGKELRADDEDVWLYITHLARGKPLDGWIEFVPYQALKALGWPASKHYYDKLFQCLDRMRFTNLKVVSRRLRKGLMLSLIRKFEYTDVDGRLARWRVMLEPEIQAMFGDMHYTQVEWRQRQQLGPLGKRLHGLYASHEKPFAMKVSTLWKGSGSGEKHLRSFRQSLRVALGELQTVGFLQSWRIDEHDLVHVERNHHN